MPSRAKPSRSSAGSVSARKLSTIGFAARPWPRRAALRASAWRRAARDWRTARSVASTFGLLGDELRQSVKSPGSDSTWPVMSVGIARIAELRQARLQRLDGRLPRTVASGTAQALGRVGSQRARAAGQAEDADAGVRRRSTLRRQRQTCPAPRPPRPARRSCRPARCRTASAGRGRRANGAATFPVCEAVATGPAAEVPDFRATRRTPRARALAATAGSRSPCVSPSTNSRATRTSSCSTIQSRKSMASTSVSLPTLTK